MFFTFVVIDSILLVRKSIVAKTRKRFMRSTIEPFNQSAFMKEVTEISEFMKRQEEIFIQRDFFHFEIVEGIVSGRKIPFIRDRIVSRSERAKNRDKVRNENRDRDKKRDGRNEKSEKNASSRNENGR